MSSCRAFHTRVATSATFQRLADERGRIDRQIDALEQTSDRLAGARASADA